VNLRWSEQDLDAVRQRLSGGRPVFQRRKPAKYRNQPTFVDGLRFASKREADYYQQLRMAKAAGAIRGFTRQVSLPLASGKRRMVIDFVVVELTGQVRWIDAKGFATEAWKVKRDELESSLGVQIETV
jgi:Protein of unknown function (DUF1064)